MIAYTPTEMEAIRLAGEQAQELHESPAFINTMNDLSNLHLTALAACRPVVESDREARDYHHLMLHALKEIEAQLTTRISYGQEMALRLLEVTEEDE